MDIFTKWDDGILGPGTYTSWDDVNGGPAETQWDLIPSDVGRAIRVVWEAVPRRARWQISRRVKWKR